MTDKEKAIKKLEEKLNCVQEKIVYCINDDGTFSNIMYLTRQAEDLQRVLNVLKDTMNN